MMIFVLTMAALFTSASQAGELTIQEGLATVTSEGWDVRISGSREAAARQALPMSRSARLPKVSLNAGYTALRYQPEAIFGAGTSFMADKNSLTYGISVSQLLYDFGRSGSAIASAAAKADAAGFSAEQSKNSAALDFIMAYISLLDAQSGLSIVSEEVKQFEAHINDAKALYEAGMVTKNDILQGDVSLADARQRRISARNRKNLSAARINMLLLRDLSDEVKPEDLPETVLEFDLNLEKATENALVNRRELMMLQRNVDRKEAALRKERADRYPLLTARGGYAYEENSFRVHQDNWSLSAGLTWDLYSGGRKGAAVRKADAELDTAELELEQMKEVIKLQVKDAFLALESAKAKMVVSNKAVNQASENLRLMRAIYEEGEGSATEVTDAVTMSTRAEQNLNRAVYGRQRAEAALLYAQGQDLVEVYNR